jgi:hypothetical protein
VLAESDRDATELATLQAALAASRAQWEASDLDASLFANLGVATTSAAAAAAAAASGGGAADDETMDIALALRRSADESKAAEGEDVKRAMLESLSVVGGGGGGGGFGGGGGGNDDDERLGLALASLTEEEQINCVLLGITPAQFLAQRGSAPLSPQAPAAAGGAGGAAGAAGAGAGAGAGGGAGAGAGAAMQEEEDLAMAIMLSTQTR